MTPKVNELGQVRIVIDFIEEEWGEVLEELSKR